MRLTVYCLILQFCISLTGCNNDKECDPLILNGTQDWWPVQQGNKWFYYAENDCLHIEREGISMGRVVPPETEENYTDSLIMFLVNPINCITCPENVRYGITLDGDRIYRLNLEIMDDLGAELHFNFNTPENSITPAGFKVTSKKENEVIFSKGLLNIGFKKGLGLLTSIYKDRAIAEVNVGQNHYVLDCNALNNAHKVCRKCEYCDGCC